MLVEDPNRKADVDCLNVAGGCAIITPVESFFIGIVGSFLSNITAKLLIYLKVDDAVGASCVHGKTWNASCGQMGKTLRCH